MPTNTQTPASELPTQPNQQQAIYYFLTDLKKCYKGNYCTVTEIKSDAEAVMFRMKNPDAVYKNEYGILFNISITAPQYDSHPSIRDIPIPVFIKDKFNILKKYLKNIKYGQVSKMDVDEWYYKSKVFCWDCNKVVYEYMDEYTSEGNYVNFGTIENKNSPYEDVSIEIETTNFEIACQIALLFDEHLFLNEKRLPSFPSQSIE